MGIEAVLALCLLPPLSDLERFPPAACVETQCRFTGEHINCLLGQQLMRRHLWWEYQAEIDGCRDMAMPWAQLAVAQEPGLTQLERREALAELKKLIGERDYFAGRMPPPVPLWRFPYVEE